MNNARRARSLVTFARFAHVTLAAIVMALGALISMPVYGDPYPPFWGSAAVHYPPVAWPNEPVDPRQCGATCGEWRPYTRFQNGIADPRTQDPSNGGTSPQNYVNIASSCVDKSFPSIYYALRQGAAPDGSQDVIMFRWRVEQIANNYATGPSAGSYGASDPWSSALWSVLFDINGDGFIDLAAHLDGSSGSPSAPVDRIVGIWSKLPTQSLDYIGDPTNVKLLGHNPTAFVDAGTNRILNFQNAVTPSPNWPNGAAETRWDYGTTRSKVVSTSPCNEYFIDYQIPVPMIDASSLGGPKVTRSTPISMLFCTANSLNNPFQKDCALNRGFVGSAGKPGPFGDYISFDQTTPYAQPIISSVTATGPASCPGSYNLTAVVQDTLAVVNGVIVPSVKSVRFFYYYDANGNGLADDGGAWTLATDATLKAGSLNTWTAAWDATALAKGQYLIGVQAVDDNTKVDDGMTPTGVDNRTFSYVAGDAQNRINVGGSAFVALPSHSPSQSPTASENWWGNPSVTGTQTALVGVANNACGVAPTLTKSASVANVAPSGNVDFTLTIANPLPTAITVNALSDALPAGFTLASTLGGSLVPTTSPANGAGGNVSWTFSPPVTIAGGGSGTLQFRAVAASVSGSYNNAATATTSFGTLASPPVPVAVDSARLTLSKTPSTLSINPDGTTQLVYTLGYANASSVAVTNAQITDALPGGVSFVGCGGASCANSSGTVTWMLGTLAAGASGSATLTVTVNPGYSATSLVNAATLTANDPANSPVSASASSTIAVIQPVPTAPAFTLSKSANLAQVAPAGSVTWTLGYSNYGTAGATGVTITDALPTGFTFSGCTGGSACSNTAGTITWTIGAVAAGASGSVTVTAVAANPFTSPNPATNTGSVNWTQNSGAPVTASAQVGVTGQSCSNYFFHAATTNVGAGADGGVRSIANATAPISASPATVSFNATTTPVEAARFYQDPPTAATVTFSGTISTSFYVTKSNGPQLKMDVLVYDYDPASGAKTLLGSQSFSQTGSGTNQLFTFALPLAGALARDHRILWIFNAYSNNTTTFTFNFDGTGSPSGSSFCVTPPPNLTLAKSVNTPSAPSGSVTPIQYTLAFANTGQSKSTATQIVDTLPAGVSFVSATLNGVTITPVQLGQQLTFSGVKSSSGSVAGEVLGGSTGTLLIDASIGAGASGTLTNNATVSSAETAAVMSSAATTLTGGGGSGTPALAVGLAADRSTAVPGDTVTYTVTVVNTGTASAAAVQLTDVLPLAPYYTFGICSGGCVNSSGTLTWNIGALATGASATRTFTMIAGGTGLPAGVTVISDTASASATAVAPVSSNSVNVSLNGNPRLTLAKSALPASGVGPGSTLNWTLTLTNAGNGPATTVVVTDPIPPRTSFAGNISASLGSGTFDAVNNRVVFDVGTLAAGASATLGFATTIGDLPPGSTSIANTATASAANAAATTASAMANASANAILDVTKHAPLQSAYPAATLTHAANGTTLVVNDTTQLTVGEVIAVGATLATVTAVNGGSIGVDTPIIAPIGTFVVAAVEYSISVTNSGNASAAGVVVTDALPPGASFVDATDGGTFATGVVTWNLGSIDHGSARTVNLTLIPGGPGALTNVASATCTSCAPANASADTSVGGLRVTKRTTTPVASAGSAATYVIDVVNTSGTTLAGVTVDDTLPSGFTYATTTSIVNDGAAVSASTSPAPGETIPTWGTFSIGAGKTLTITFVANIAPTVGAAKYQNAAGASPVASTVAFDPLTSLADDVTILAASTGLLQGRVYQDNDANGIYDPAIDVPLANVDITIVDSTATTFTLTTDADGLYSRVVAAGAATVDVDDADLPPGVVAGAGFSDPDGISVPDGGAVTHDVAFVIAASAPDLTIAKNHTGNFAQGQSGATYAINVTNIGGGPTVGQVSVVDTLPAGLTATALGGTGWSCSLAGLTCTRGDSLAAGASYPVITLTADVAANAPASIINIATVSGGADVNAANNSASDATNVDVTAPTSPDLAIVKSHIGNFTQGQSGASYTLTVSNVGTGPTTGTVTVSDTLPAGLVATSFFGTGWTCSLPSPTCTRADPLAVGASYPPITLTVDVSATAASTLVNVASVGGGGDANVANNSSSDSTTVTPTVLTAPDLAIAKTHTGNFTQGQTGASYTLTVSNVGTGATVGSVTVTDTLPAGLTATSVSGTGWTCNPGTATCTRGDALAAGASYPAITLTVDVAANAAATIVNTASISGGGDSNAANDNATDSTSVTPVVPVSPDLAIVKTHVGTFVRGGSGGTFSISVINVGSGSTSGVVTVTDSLPAGLSATALSGSGWTCTLATLTCTRADALAAGASYPLITVAVSVALDAAGSITNVASVAGGGDSSASNNVSADSIVVGAPQRVVTPVPVSNSALALLAVLLAVAAAALQRRAARCR